MSGLREKQKQRRRVQIEQAAMKLFDEKGFESTTIDEIAAEAMVSPATVYNYYGTKGEVLLAIVAHGEEGTRERLDEITALAKTLDPSELIPQIICNNMQDTLTHVPRSLWGHVVAYIATTKDPDVAPRYLSTISEPLTHAIHLALNQYLTLGKINKIDTEHFASILTRLERNHFLGYLYMKTMTLESLLAGLTKDVSMLMETVTLPSEQGVAEKI
jgi:AcrR family transcriptional regulator